jgi:hypothetical protein
MTMVTRPARSPSAPAAPDATTRQGDDGVEVVLDPDGFVVVRLPIAHRGSAQLDEARTREALALARRLAALWAQDPERLPPATVARAEAVRRTLPDALVPGLDELDPVPHATIEQAKRRAQLRTNLLASGAYTLAALVDGRGQTMAAVRQWVHRARQRGQIFTVKHDGETLVPAFLLDHDLNPRPEYTGAITALTAVGSKEWALWAWFASPTGWLDGRVPAEHALVDPDDVTRAAQDDASNAE